MKIYTVYRFDYISQVKSPVGRLVERRRVERRNNAEDILKWAQKLYATSPMDSHIFVTPEG